MHRRLALLVVLAALFSACTASSETLRNPFRIPTKIDPASVAAGDLNGDGIPDMVWADYAGQATLHVLLSQPGGSWTSGADIAYPIVTTGPPACLMADFNQDGRQDLVCISANASIPYLHVFLGNGDGTLQSPVSTALITLTADGDGPPSLSLVGDLNGDSFPDLYMVDRVWQQAHVLLSDGKGGFKAPLSAPAGVNAVLPVGADLNGDGIPDLVFQQGPEVALGKGDGSFGTVINYAKDVHTEAVCIFHDMDGDGHLDAVCGYLEISGATDLIILQGKADGSFNTSPIARKTFGGNGTLVNGMPAFVNPVAAVDLNGDGILDILASAGDGLTVLLGNGNLTYGDPAHYAQAVVSLQGVLTQYQSLVQDMNGDGIPDIVNTGPNGIYISFGKHDGTYISASAPEVTEVISYPTVADFNGDGFPDIVAAGDTSLKLSLGKGDGTFSAPVALPNNGAVDYSFYGYSDVIHGDFNGDGKQDLFAAGVFNDGVTSSALGFFLYLGHGDGTFADPVQVPPNPDFLFDAQALNDAGIHDINGDGKDDLLVVYSEGNNGFLQFDLSSGDGTFKIVSNPVPLDREGSFSVPAIADFNGDGKLDAVYGSQSNAYYVKGHGDGTFDTTGAKMPIPALFNMASQGSISAAAADFDGDGFQDFVLLVNYSTGTQNFFPHPEATAAWVFYGHGDGTFSTPVLAGNFDHNYELVSVADLNKDGLADIILRTNGSDLNEYAVGVVHSLPARTFGPEINYTAGTGVSSLAIADLNKDGFPDLVFGNGDQNIKASSVTVLMNEGNSAQVTGTLVTSPNPSAVGQAFTLTATLTPAMPATLTGTVQFMLNGVNAGSGTLSGNVAAATFSSKLAPGDYPFTATWPGDSTYPAVTLSATHVVTGAATALALGSSNNPARAGSAVTFTATITSADTGTPTGSVAFRDGDTPLGTVPLTNMTNSAAALTTSALSAGKHTIAATYSGGGGFSGSTASLVETIVGLATTASLNSSPNPAYALQQIDAIARVGNNTGNPPTGAVTLNVAGVPLTSTALNSGSAGFAFSLADAGTYSLTASYPGDSENSPSTSSPLVQTILLNPTTSVITKATNPAIAFRPVTFTAAVNSSTVRQPSPDGTVTLFAAATRLGTTAASPNLSFTTSALAAGVYSITAVYSGSKAFAASTSAPFQLTVERAPSAIQLSSNANPALAGSSVAFTATVSGPAQPTAAVTFLDEGKPLGAPVPVDSHGVAILTSKTLSLGLHAITAAYPGDANLLPATSPTLQQSIVAYTGDFAIQVEPASAAFYAGESATFHIAITPSNGFKEPLSLTCASLPEASTCAFSHASLPNGDGEATLLLQSSAPHRVANASLRSPWKPAPSPPVCCSGFPSARAAASTAKDPVSTRSSSACSPSGA